jgi:aspartyl-tRNA(Asn)/glutamyl-tRNA(Gln) amidotransferase subunit A
LGSDTGGSVRIPASYCGLVGLKATYGLVPLRGILPCVLSLDHCGPMARSVEDSALLLNQVAGYDPLDFTSVEHPREDYVAALGQPVAGFRLGLPVSFFDQLDPEVAAAAAEALGVLRRMTSGAKEIELPATGDTGMDGDGVGIGAEFYAFQEEYFRKNPAGYMPPERRRIEAWAAIHGGNAADYARGLWALQRLRRTIDQTFADVDLLVLPTQRILPPTNADYLREVYNPPAGKAPLTSNCPPFNIYGIPALSLPCGFSRQGLPIGLMIVGPRFSEGRVLALARAYEQATPWRFRRPLLKPTTPVPA